MPLTLKTIQPPMKESFVGVVEATFSNSYPSGGETFPAANAGLQTLDFAFPIVVQGDEAKSSEQFIAGAYHSGGKLHLINAKTGKEVEAGKNMEKVKVRVLCFGKARAK